MHLNQFTIAARLRMMAVLFILFSVWLWLALGGIRNDVSLGLTGQLKVTLAVKDMDHDVVQVQQFLSDVSATRGKDGLDDGFKNAEAAHTEFLKNLSQVEQFLQKNGKPGPCTFTVEVVTTPEEQARGLMFRERMDPDAGMLFDFHGDEMRYFWMRNTLIPLDMIFIGTDMKVVHIHRWAKPKDESNISSKFPARYVLEINGGRAASCRIEAGLKARFINLSP